MSSDSLRYKDDSSILDDAELWRRVPSWHIIEDDNQGGKRISSAAFTDHSNGTPMSVFLGDDVRAAGRSPDSLIDGHIDFCLASVTAGFVRSLRQIVLRRPLPEEPTHAEVAGKKNKSIQRKLAKSATWIIAPEE